MLETLESLIKTWESGPRPAHTEYQREAALLAEASKEKGLHPLWEKDPPLMLTATVDDGWGMGLALIETWARLLGLHVTRVGLLMEAKAIISACRDQKPGLLGLTVLQFTSEETVREITASLPPETVVTAGGPPLNADADFAKRTGIHMHALDAGKFVSYLVSQKQKGAPPFTP